MTAHLRTLARALGAAILGALALGAAASPATADDRHTDYYYPSHSSEIYISRAQTLPDADHEKRIAFVIGFTAEQLSHEYPPQFALFAKGDAAQKMIIMALNDGAIASLYQARGLLAQLTAIARSTQFFRELAVEDFFTFFDLAKLLGFTQLTISDGRTYAHQVAIQ